MIIPFCFRGREGYQKSGPSIRKRRLDEHGQGSLGVHFADGEAFCAKKVEAQGVAKSHCAGKAIENATLPGTGSAGHSQNSYRGLVQINRSAENARNFSQCDSLLLGDKCGAHTWPYIKANNSSAILEHEATTSKISEDQLFYCQQRGISAESAVGLIVNGYAKDVLKKLPMEFAVEAQKLLSISLEGSVG